MTAMLAQLQQQRQTHLPNAEHFLISLSGGVDSVVLLHLFKQANLSVRAIHIHHGLSPNADSWANFCQQLCQQWEIPLRVERVLVSGKQGLEAAARHARYQAIAKHIQPNEVLATAHHLDDQAETFFLALKRGSGIKGLGAMQAVSHWQNFAIFRPLLHTSKVDILAYAKRHQFHWIEDESNQSNAYDRNFLRNVVLPLLNQRWGQFSESVARSAMHCANQQRLIEELLEETLAMRFEAAKKSLEITGFEHFSRLKQQQLVRLWLVQCNVPMPSEAQLGQIIDRLIFAKQDKNPQLVLAENIVRRFQHRLFVTREMRTFPDFSAVLPPSAKLILPDELGEIWRAESDIIYQNSLQTDRLLLPQPLWDKTLHLRLAHSGKVKCYAKSQREEMKKIYQQKGVPVWERERTPLVFFNDQWVGILAL